MRRPMHGRAHRYCRRAFRRRRRSPQRGWSVSSEGSFSLFLVLFIIEIIGLVEIFVGGGVFHFVSAAANAIVLIDRIARRIPARLVRISLGHAYSFRVTRERAKQVPRLRYHRARWQSELVCRPRSQADHSALGN